MKAVLILIFIVLNVHCFAQLGEGFKKEEARDMAAICNSFPFLDLYQSDSEILPPGYKKIYTSGVFGMDNKYQIYRKENIAVINLRGSTGKKISWLENINSAMIPAKGVITASGERFEYCFAKDTSAAVHGGYVLGIVFLSKDIIYQIKAMNREGVYHFIITGHSQGGALSNMLRAYLENLPLDQLSEKNRFKTYAFASPMIGNKEFTQEYNAKYCINNTSFNIIIPEDPIPSFPLSYNDTTRFLAEKLKTALFDTESFSLKKTVSEGTVLLFEESLTKAVKRLGHSASEQISKDLGPVVMPPFVKDINYQRLNNQIEIKAVDYPKVLKDASILKNDSLMSNYKKGNDGYFLNDELYTKEPWNYQHKPYNYYISVLKTYFPSDYKLLERKYLPENL